MGRNQVRVIGVALSAIGAMITLQACGSASSTSTSAPLAASAALPTAISAAEATATPEPTATTKPTASATPKPVVPTVSPEKVALAQPLVEGTPCTVAAKACVDLDSQRAWLFDGKGKIVRGPVNVASGGKTEPTPPGYDLRVSSKDQNHVSNESFTNGVPDPMPYSVFFEAGGIAFHEGDPENPSGGCVHLSSEDAKAWFAYLQVGDQVQAVNASQVMAARGLKYTGATYGFGGVREWDKQHGDDDDSKDSSKDAGATATATATATADGNKDSGDNN